MTAQELVLSHERNCRYPGELWDAVNNLRESHGSIMRAQAIEQGRSKQSAWIVTIVMLLIGISSVAAAWTAALRRDDKTANATDAVLQELHSIKVQLSAHSN